MVMWPNGPQWRGISQPLAKYCNDTHSITWSSHNHMHETEGDSPSEVLVRLVDLI